MSPLLFPRFVLLLEMWTQSGVGVKHFTSSWHVFHKSKLGEMLIFFSVVHNCFQIQIAYIFPLHWADTREGSSLKSASQRILKQVI